jgi:hypothetical protein
MQLLSLNNTMPGDLFTPASIGTLAGATGAVYIICGTLQKVFNFNPKWLALLVSILISFVAALVTQPSNNEPLKYFIALLNGFLIYATATGSNQVLGNPPESVSAPLSTKRLLLKRRKFNTKWWNS